MIAVQTIIDNFLIPLDVSKKNCEHLRKRILKCFSTNKTDTLAVRRALDIFYKSEIQFLTLGFFETYQLTDLTNTESLENINVKMQSSNDYVFPALDEVVEYIPRETRELLKNMFGVQSPLERIAVMVYIVLLAILEQELRA